MKTTKFYFWDIDKVKGPQICSINSGFLKIDIIIALFSINRVNYVFGFIDNLFCTIVIINYTKYQNRPFGISYKINNKIDYYYTYFLIR